MFRHSLIVVSALCILTILWGSSSIYYRPFQNFPARLAIESLRLTATPSMQTTAASYSQSERIQELIVLLQSLDAFFADGLNRVNAHGLIVYDDQITEATIQRLSGDLHLSRQSALSWMLATRLIRMSDLPEREAFDSLVRDYLLMASDLRLRLLDYFSPREVDALTSYVRFSAAREFPELSAVPAIASPFRMPEPVIEPVAPPVKSPQKSKLKKAFGWLPFF